MPRILLWTWPHIAAGHKQDFNFLVDIVPSFQTLNNVSVADVHYVLPSCVNLQKWTLF